MRYADDAVLLADSEEKLQNMVDKVNKAGVIKMSIQSFTRLIGIESKSEDLHGACKTRRCTSLAVTHLRFCKTFLVSGGLNTRECESEGKEERMTEILLMKNELNVFARATTEE